MNIFNKKEVKMLIELYCLLFLIVSTVIIAFMNITSFYLMLPVDVMLLFSIAGLMLYQKKEKDFHLKNH